MAATTPVHVNHVGFERRLEVVKNILKAHGLEAKEIVPLEYLEHVPFHFNNFIYKVELAAPALPETFAKPNLKPGTTRPPADGIPVVVVRLSNPLAEGLNNANRVENEVAAQYLVRNALQQAGLPHRSPAVYAWETCRWPTISDEAGFAWVIGEFMPGSNLDAQFATMTFDEKKSVMEQIADIFITLRTLPLPDGVRSPGGITFAADGSMVSGEMPLLSGGPWESYEDVWAAKLRLQLSDADKSPVLQGWRPDGVRERVESLIQSGGLAKLLEGVDAGALALVHGDLTMNNMLYDAETKQITTLLDFDWATVTHPCHEFFSGLWDLGGATNPDDPVLQAAVLSGNFDAAQADKSPEERDAWELAKAWDDILKSKNASVRPSAIAGIVKLEKLRKLEESLCPFALSNEVMLKRLDDAKKDAKKRESAAVVIDILESVGF